SRRAASSRTDDQAGPALDHREQNPLPALLRLRHALDRPALSAFQFADDQVRALAEARRVSRGPVAVAVPARLADSGIAAVFAPLAGLFSVQALNRLAA